jgi:hypothetical protein
MKGDVVVKNIKKVPGLLIITVMMVIMLFACLNFSSVTVNAATKVPEVSVTKKTLQVGEKAYQIKFKNLSKSAEVICWSDNNFPMIPPARTPFFYL